MRIFSAKTNISLVALLGSFLAGSIGTAMADYHHEAWPVSKNAEGIYSFTSTGQAQAVGLCAGYYAADVKSRDEHASQETAFGRIVREHAIHMRDAYQAKFSGDQAALDKLVTDMSWHLANSAQHGEYQSFRDGAEQSCESYAVSNSIVSEDYMASFFDRLSSGL